MQGKPVIAPHELRSGHHQTAAGSITRSVNAAAASAPNEIIRSRYSFRENAFMFAPVAAQGEAAGRPKTSEVVRSGLPVIHRWAAARREADSLLPERLHSTKRRSRVRIAAGKSGGSSLAEHRSATG